jgi:hypothetical protein
MRRFWILVTLLGCGNTKVDPFKPVPECMGPTVTAFAGDRQLVLSQLAIADYGEGFDLDLNGDKDNKLAALGALANKQIAANFQKAHDIVIPFELFGYNGEANTMCTKLSFYVGSYNQDRDMDGKTTTWDKGDCLDTDPNVKPGMTENLTNRLDDDCDGYADNMTAGSPPTGGMAMMDQDGDGYSLAQGDCDDRSDATNKAVAMTRHPGAKDVCDDGIDQNCDGIPDNDPSCDPFMQNNVTVRPTAPSFVDPAAMPPVPLIAFKDGKVQSTVFNAGPDLFQVTIPIQGLNIFIQLSGTHLQMTLADDFANKLTNATGGMLGGVLEAVSLAGITGINASDVCKKDQSLLDCIFVGAVGTILGLDTDKDGHSLPDIDVDGDGIESFWNTNPPAAGQSIHVDTCKDGDGTIVMGTDCPTAKDAKGNYRFVDGLSMALKFNAVPVKISSTIVPK